MAKQEQPFGSSLRLPESTDSQGLVDASETHNPQFGGLGSYCLGGIVENMVSALIQPSICAVRDT